MPSLVKFQLNLKANSVEILAAILAAILAIICCVALAINLARSDNKRTGSNSRSSAQDEPYQTYYFASKNCRWRSLPNDAVKLMLTQTFLWDVSTCLQLLPFSRTDRRHRTDGRVRPKCIYRQLFANDFSYVLGSRSYVFGLLIDARIVALLGLRTRRDLMSPTQAANKPLSGSDTKPLRRSLLHHCNRSNAPY